jgi:hypothetical protein
MRLPQFVISLIALVRTIPVVAAEPISSPKDFLGFAIGDDYHLANYQQLSAYWHKLAQQSDRVKVVRIGTTEEGRPQLMAIITSPQNHARLEEYRQISRRLAWVEVADETEARRLARVGKAVVWIDGGLHANETLGAQMLIEQAYRLASSEDEETRRILDDVILLLVHANPDGMDLVSDWYMRESDPKKRSLGGLPRLYQKYVGHDNNRDFYASTQAETKNMNRVMYHEWLPQIVYNHHQTGPPGTVLFCPPFRDPFNYNIDPLVISGIDALGAAMMQRFLVEGKPGATTRSGARYSTWWNGGLRTTCYFHNMIGLLTETIGSPTPMQIPYRPSLQLPRGDYLAPIPPGPWSFRQSIEYTLTANMAVLDYASRHRESLLYNIWHMGRSAIDKGSRDHWTITPRVVEASRHARGPNDFVAAFRDPSRRDPRGYILPADQPDFLTAFKFIRALMETGVQVHRATADFTVHGKTYPAGSFIVKSAQPFRAHVLDMFEPQDHPNDFAQPGGPPTPPYDIAGWTLAFQMGIQFDRILDAFDGPFERLAQVPEPPTGSVMEGAAGFLLDARVNDAFRAVNRLLAADETVYRLRESWNQWAPGTFFIPKRASTQAAVQKCAREFGVSFQPCPETPPAIVRVKPPRVALWDRYGGSMPSGWTRWILERFEFPFEVVYAPQIDAGHLARRYDVLILVDGAITGRGGRAGNAPTPPSGDQPPPAAPPDESRIPAEYRLRRGAVTPERTAPKLREFLTAGGTIVTIGSATQLASWLDVPVKPHLVTTGADGREVPISRERFYVPGSILRVRVDPQHPIAWGMPNEVDVMFQNSPVFRRPTPSPDSTIDVVAWFDSPSPLRSGWAWGQEHLQSGAAILQARVGKGHLLLCGPEVLFRAQPHGTFRFVFNALLNSSQSEDR